MNTTEIQRIIRDYYEWIYHQFGLSISKNHSTFQVWNMKKYKIWIDWSLVKRLRLIKKKQPPQNISPGPHAFSSEFCETFKEDLIPVLLKPFQTVEMRVLLNTFYKAIITLIRKPGEDNMQKRKLQDNISDEHRCKSLQQNIKQIEYNTLKGS